jgi:hypothetical protein
MVCDGNLTPQLFLDILLLTEIGNKRDKNGRYCPKCQEESSLNKTPEMTAE